MNPFPQVVRFLDFAKTNGIEPMSLEKEINLEHVFDYVEIESEYLTELVKKVLSQIHRFVDVYEIGFHSIIERMTFTGAEAEVTTEREIILDTEQLKIYEDDVVMAIIAHEFAHYFLGHHLGKPEGLEFEDEADQLAAVWGFDVSKFREVCGPPTLAWEREIII